MTVISAGRFYGLIDCRWRPSRCCASRRCRSRLAVKIYLPVACAVVVALLAGLMGGSMLLWAVLAGADTGAAVRSGGLLMLLNAARHDVDVATAAFRRQPTSRQPWSTC